MVYQTLKEIANVFRLSCEIDEDRIELLREGWNGGDFDFVSSLNLSESEFRTVKAMLAIPRSRRTELNAELITGDRQIYLGSFDGIVSLSSNEPSPVGGSFAVTSEIWGEISAKVASALEGEEG